MADLAVGVLTLVDAFPLALELRRRRDDFLAEGGQVLILGEITEPGVDPFDPTLSEAAEVVDQLGSRGHDRALSERRAVVSATSARSASEWTNAICC